MNLRLLLNVPDSHYSRNTTAAKTSATSPHNTVAHFRSSSKLQPIMPWRPLGPNMAMQGMKKSMVYTKESDTVSVIMDAIFWKKVICVLCNARDVFESIFPEI